VFGECMARWTQEGVFEDRNWSIGPGRTDAER